MAITYIRIDNEDLSKVIAAQTKLNAVADRDFVRRSEQGSVVDQLSGAAGKTRHYKIDTADLYKYMKDAMG